MDKLSQRFIVLVLFSFTFQDGLCKQRAHRSRSSDGKIVGGSETSILKVPHQAYLLLQKGSDYFQCGGSIATSKVILTAAHCIDGIEKIYVRVGSANSNSGGYSYVSTNFTAHPNYNKTTFDYDVALVYLNRPINTLRPTTRPVSLLAFHTPTAGENVTVTGWGATSENGDTSSVLMSVTVPIVSNDECRKSYPQLTDRMFCAGVPEGGKDSCQGDSGGPAVRQHDVQQYGIVSFGLGCARPGIPGVYTNVVSVQDWIFSNLRY